MDPKKRFGIKKKIIEPIPKVVGAPRNEFGTRLCQRVQCEKCQKIDYVAVRVSLARSRFCRDCAEKYLAAYDRGRHINERQVSRICGQCRRDFLVKEAIAQKKEQLLCADCFRGFDVWRGSATDRRSAASARAVLLRIGSRTTFRKNIDDKH
jgi:hypothetical protein